MAPSFANLLADFENNLLSHTPNNLTPLIWKRYIDDIFMIWTHGLTSLTTFFSYINSYHPTIKFQHTHSPNRVDYLDTTIYLTEDKHFRSTIFIKPTDSTLLLHHSSHHPNNCKTSTIYSQALRYRRLITDDEHLHTHLNRLRLILLARGYPNSTITHEFNKIQNITQQELIIKSYTTQLTNTTIQPVIPFIIPFHTDLPPIPKILHSHWDLLTRDPELSEHYKKPPVTAFKRHKNLKDMLVHTKFLSKHKAPIPTDTNSLLSTSVATPPSSIG
jgi:hypothetical protein